MNHISRQPTNLTPLLSAYAISLFMCSCDVQRAIEQKDSSSDATEMINPRPDEMNNSVSTLWINHGSDDNLIQCSFSGKNHSIIARQSTWSDISVPYERYDISILPVSRYVSLRGVMEVTTEDSNFYKIHLYAGDDSIDLNLFGHIIRRLPFSDETWSLLHGIVFLNEEAWASMGYGEAEGMHSGGPVIYLRQSLIQEKLLEKSKWPQIAGIIAHEWLHRKSNQSLISNMDFFMPGFNQFFGLHRLFQQERQIDDFNSEGLNAFFENIANTSEAPFSSYFIKQLGEKTFLDMRSKSVEKWSVEEQVLLAQAFFRLELTADLIPGSTDHKPFAFLNTEALRLSNRLMETGLINAEYQLKKNPSELSVQEKSWLRILNMSYLEEHFKNLPRNIYKPGLFKWRWKNDLNLLVWNDVSPYFPTPYANQNYEEFKAELAEHLVTDIFLAGAGFSDGWFVYDAGLAVNKIQSWYDHFKMYQKYPERGYIYDLFIWYGEKPDFNAQILREYEQNKNAVFEIMSQFNHWRNKGYISDEDHLMLKSLYDMEVLLNSSESMEQIEQNRMHLQSFLSAWKNIPSDELYDMMNLFEKNTFLRSVFQKSVSFLYGYKTHMGDKIGSSEPSLVFLSGMVGWMQFINNSHVSARWDDMLKSLMILDKLDVLPDKEWFYEELFMKISKPEETDFFDQINYIIEGNSGQRVGLFLASLMSFDHYFRTGETETFNQLIYEGSIGNLFTGNKGPQLNIDKFIEIGLLHHHHKNIFFSIKQITDSLERQGLNLDVYLRILFYGNRVIKLHSPELENVNEIFLSELIRVSGHLTDDQIQSLIEVVRLNGSAYQYFPYNRNQMDLNLIYLVKYLKQFPHEKAELADYFFIHLSQINDLLDQILYPAADPEDLERWISYLKDFFMSWDDLPETDENKQLMIILIGSGLFQNLNKEKIEYFKNILSGSIHEITSQNARQFQKKLILIDLYSGLNLNQGHNSYDFKQIDTGIERYASDIVSECS